MPSVWPQALPSARSNVAPSAISVIGPVEPRVFGPDVFRTPWASVQQIGAMLGFVPVGALTGPTLWQAAFGPSCSSLLALASWARVGGLLGSSCAIRLSTTGVYGAAASTDGDAGRRRQRRGQLIGDVARHRGRRGRGHAEPKRQRCDSDDDRNESDAKDKAPAIWPVSSESAHAESPT